MKIPSKTSCNLLINKFENSLQNCMLKVELNEVVCNI